MQKSAVQTIRMLLQNLILFDESVATQLGMQFAFFNTHQIYHGMFLQNLPTILCTNVGQYETSHRCHQSPSHPKIVLAN